MKNMMPFQRRSFCAVLLVTLAGCAIPATPIVSEFNGDSVTIVTSAFADPASVKQKTQEEASRICAKGPKKRAEYASTRTNQQTYEQSHLFLCLN
ncbi:hypothetical protein FIU94_10605 [Sulfitobacter sp. THAF37]|uniref:hypothetical protein n=1 Tax=Sulfitobacter sp. THAF37 TaxID=2587855 RepID=UPI001268A75E|nr:hypothetical protein [Sulfitobacter sp. THAF37]QFT59276.1 hypothetical protein FIU94_10605 [Sulfitobacter sp. THAF37]